jgi:hypothetical protein
MPLNLYIIILYLITSFSDALRAISSNIFTAAYYIGRAKLA